MRKISSICLFTLIPFSVFSFSLQHHYSSDSQFSKSTSIAKENFSGLWAGRCENNDVEIKIIQDNEKITFHWDQKNSDTFYLNALVTDQKSISKKQSQANLEFVFFHQNYLTIRKNQIKVMGSGEGFTQSLTQASMFKYGNLLELVDDQSESREKCKLTKVED